MTRELIEAAVIAQLATETVAAYTTGEVNAEGFTAPGDAYAEVRVSPTSRGLTRGSAQSATAGWSVEVEIVGTEAVNVNRYLDRCSNALYGHRFTVGGATSTPTQEGPSDPAEPTADKRFSAIGEWTFAL